MLNWIVIGIGDITTRRVIPAIQAEPRSRLYGLVTRDPGKAAPYHARSWTTLEEALSDPAVHAVYVATPVFLHAPQTIQTLRAGRHVLCEKPMAMNEAEARSMVEIAEQSGRTFGVAYYRRMYPKVRRAKQLLDAGVIGQPVVAELTSHGWFDENETHRSWLLDPAQAGGGPLFDIASHRIDAMNFLFGKVERACGLLSNAVHRMAVEDSATVLVQLPGGVHAVIDVRWNSRIPRDQFRIIGEEGEINLDPLNGPELCVTTRSESRTEHLPPHANLHYPLVENFVDTVLDNDPTRLACPAEQGAWVDWVIEQVVGEQVVRSIPLLS